MRYLHLPNAPVIVMLCNFFSLAADISEGGKEQMEAHAPKKGRGRKQ